MMKWCSNDTIHCQLEDKDKSSSEHQHRQTPCPTMSTMTNTALINPGLQNVLQRALSVSIQIQSSITVHPRTNIQIKSIKDYTSALGGLTPMKTLHCWCTSGLGSCTPSLDCSPDLTEIMIDFALLRAHDTGDGLAKC